MTWTFTNSKLRFFDRALAVLGGGLRVAGKELLNSAFAPDPNSVSSLQHRAQVLLRHLELCRNLLLLKPLGVHNSHSSRPRRQPLLALFPWIAAGRRDPLKKSVPTLETIGPRVDANMEALELPPSNGIGAGQRSQARQGTPVVGASSDPGDDEAEFVAQVSQIVEKPQTRRPGNRLSSSTSKFVAHPRRTPLPMNDT